MAGHQKQLTYTNYIKTDGYEGLLEDMPDKAAIGRKINHVALLASGRVPSSAKRLMPKEKNCNIHNGYITSCQLGTRQEVRMEEEKKENAY